jgi:hypothetical protein
MAEKPTERQFVVLSKKFVHGAVGDTITLVVTDNQEKSLLESGAVKRAEVPAPRAAVKERK